MSSPVEVAIWLLARVSEDSPLYQEVVVHEIADQFGEDFVYSNDNGNLAIDRKVLAEFRKISAHSVIWDRAERYWRLREAEDSEGRQQ